MLDFKNGMNGFFHSLIPKKLRESIHVQDAAYIKVRALSAVLFFFLVFQIIQISAVGVWHGIYHPELLKHDAFSVGILLLFIIQSALYYRFSNHWLSSLIFTSIYFLIIVIMVVMSGGHNSSMKILLLTCPFIAFLIGDKHEGIQASALVVIIGLVLALFDAIYFETPDLFSDAYPPTIFAIDFAITLAIVTLAIMIYESALKKSEEGHIDSTNYLARQIKDSRMTGIDMFIHNLVPPLLREKLSTNSLDYVRARFLSVTLMSLVILEALTTLPAIARFWLFEANTTDMLVPHGSAILILLMFAMQLWMFRRFGNQELSGIIFTNSYFMVVMALVISSGGYESPLKYLLITCPIITFVTRGVNEGMQNSLYTLIGGVSLSLLEANGFSFPDFFTSGRHSYMTFCSAWIIALSIITACILVYETELQRRFRPGK